MDTNYIITNDHFTKNYNNISLYYNRLGYIQTFIRIIDQSIINIILPTLVLSLNLFYPRFPSSLYF